MVTGSYHPFKSAEAKNAYLTWYDSRAKNWPVESEERFVETSFGQTFVRISGAEDAPPVVLLPGDSENSLSWIPQVSELSAVYRTYAVDQIYDIGRSVHSMPIRRPQDFVAWLDELFTALGLEQINLIGHSYGGWLASIYALAHQDRLRRLAIDRTIRDRSTTTDRAVSASDSLLLSAVPIRDAAIPVLVRARLGSR